jgi:RNA polymerase sigma-70 factor, ECF subfamily
MDTTFVGRFDHSEKIGRRPSAVGPSRQRAFAMENEQIQTLVERARNGDRLAFGELAEQFEQTVFWIVMRRLRNRAEAEEVTQDVFVQAMRKLPQLREADRFAGWLKRIAVRMSINRAVRGPQESASAPETFNGLADVPCNPLEDVLRTERAEELRAGLDRLRALDRQTLVAFYFEGQTLKEMSDEFASPIGTIKRRLHTARNRLRDELLKSQPA